MFNTMKAIFYLYSSVLIIVSSVFVLSCDTARKADSPIRNSRQILLVIAANDSVHTGDMYAFTRTGSSWQKTASFPVAIGGNGLGWGIGLHDGTDSDPAEPGKSEGDGKSPMGVFELGQAYGYLPPEVVDTRLPYTQSDSDLVCIDDAENEYYNMVVNIREKGLNTAHLPSHEEMVRRDSLYKFTVFVEHNTESAEKGAGSCIFLHLWGGEDSHTAGCTAMAEPDMVKLLSWLDPEKRPVLVQLTRKNYKRLRNKWGLPVSEP